MSEPIFNLPILNDLLWLPSNHGMSHLITYPRFGHKALDEKPLPQMAFSLAKVDSQVALLDMVFNGNAWRGSDQFTGLESLYSTVDASKAQNAVNVLNGGGKRDLNSAYLVGWSSHTAYMAYHCDSFGQLFAGLVVADWRYIVRIANVDANSDIGHLATRAALMLPSSARHLTAFYMGRHLHERYAAWQMNAGVGSLAEIKAYVVPCLNKPEGRVE